MANWLSIDLGGASIDLLLSGDDGASQSARLPAPAVAERPAAAAAAAATLVAGAGLQPGRIDQVSVAVDLLNLPGSVERTVGLLVSAAIERAPLPQHHDLPLVRVQGVRERRNARGDLVTPLDLEQARSALQALLGAGVDALAVLLLHAGANPEHEHRLAALATELAPQLPLTLSAQLTPAGSDTERLPALLRNAAARPAATAYVRQIESALADAGFRPAPLFATADGGLMTAAAAAERPLYTLHAGRAAALLGATSIGRRDALCLIAGTTNVVIGAVHDGAPLRDDTCRCEPFILPLPSVVLTPAAGGAGATETGASLADANLVLGRLSADGAQGSGFDLGAAEQALGRLAKTLQLDIYQAARQLADLADEAALGALRLTAARHGLDPRRLALLAGGGLGPLHANAVAALAGCEAVIVPPLPGQLAAAGLLAAAPRQTFDLALYGSLADADLDRLQTALTLLVDAVESWAQTFSEPTAGSRAATLTAALELRYRGEDDRLRLALSPDPAALDGAALERLAQRFAAEHEQRFGYRLARPLQTTLLRMTAVLPAAAPPVPVPPAAAAASFAGTRRQRQVYFDGEFIATGVYARAELNPGRRLSGPALIEQADATTLIRPGYVGEVDDRLNLLIRAAASESAL